MKDDGFDGDVVHGAGEDRFLNGVTLPVNYFYQAGSIKIKEGSAAWPGLGVSQACTASQFDHLLHSKLSFLLVGAGQEGE